MDSSNSWLLPRILVRLVAGALGGAVGYWVGEHLGHPVSIGIASAASSVLALSVTDTLKGHRLLDWLRTPEDGVPPLPGIWAEVGHRVERVLRAKDDAIALERARLSEFLSAIEASPNGVLLLDATDHITWVSAAAADHFGLNRQRDLQQRVTNLIRQPAFVQYLSLGDFREPVKVPVSRGSLTWLQVQVQEYGEGLKLLISQDITERERADTMRRDFVANVSHEIRTPLTVLSGFVETMQSIPLEESDRSRYLEMMSQQAQRMQTLVSDLLTLSRLEGSPVPGTSDWIDGEELIGHVVQESIGLSQAIAKPPHDIRRLSGPALLVSGAKSELLSAMSNLLSNAVRYTPGGGKIETGWRLREDGWGEYFVRDTGPGIAPEHIPRLTERFYRVDRSRSRETGGTGLGLAIVKHVAQRHGGHIDVTSVVGEGSEFVIALPPSRIRDRVIG